MLRSHTELKYGLTAMFHQMIWNAQAGHTKHHTHHMTFTLMLLLHWMSTAMENLPKAEGWRLLTDILTMVMCLVAAQVVFLISTQLRASVNI